VPLNSNNNDNNPLILLPACYWKMLMDSYSSKFLNSRIFQYLDLVNSSSVSKLPGITDSRESRNHLKVWINQKTWCWSVLYTECLYVFVETPTPNVLVFRGGVFGRKLVPQGHDCGVLMRDYCLTRRDTKLFSLSLCLPHSHQEVTQWQGDLWQARKKALTRNRPHQYLEFELSALLSRQVLYDLGHDPSPFCFSLFFR
jgi:hypothetical protein